GVPPIRDVPDTQGGGSSSLLVSTDADVTVSIDGDAPLRLSANSVKRFPVVPGSHIVVATSVERKTLNQRKLVEVLAGQQQAVLLEFAANEAEAARRDATNRTQSALRELVGTWTYTGEWDGVGTDAEHNSYHGKTDGSMEFTPAGDRLTGVWKEH